MTMRPTFTSSALNAVNRTSPADSALPRDATTADAKPDKRLIKPPSAADTAPWVPTQVPATSINTTVAIACHRRTVRIGLLRAGSMLFFPPEQSPSSIASAREEGQSAALQHTHRIYGVMPAC